MNVCIGGGGGRIYKGGSKGAGRVKLEGNPLGNASVGGKDEAGERERERE